MSVILIPEVYRFNGHNFTNFDMHFIPVIVSRGLGGYIDGSIIKPDPLNTVAAATGRISTASSTTSQGTTTSQTTLYTSEPSTHITSLNPYYDEWIQQNGLVFSSGMNNCINLQSLSLKLDGTAKEFYDSMKDLYGKPTALGRMEAERKYQKCTLGSSESVEKYLEDKKIAWEDLVGQGATIDLTSFLSSLATGLGANYIPIFQSIISAPNVIEAERSIQTFAAVIADAKGNSLTPTALATNTNANSCPNNGPARRERCANCRQRDHSSAQCWHPGGADRANAPEWFLQRETEAAANRVRRNGGAQAAPQANAIVVHMIAMAVVCETNLEEEDELITLFNESDPIKFEPSILAAHIPGNMDPVACVTSTTAFPLMAEGKLLTYLDSAASDHCFCNHSDFVSYASSNKLGSSALGNNGQFNISGQGIVVKEFMEGGFTTTFSSGKGIVAGPTGSFSVRRNQNWMYELGDSITFHDRPAVLTTAVLMETWHERLSHCDVDLIHEMDSKSMVEGLKLTKKTVQGSCI
ncbi:hypothetical protein C8J56DRAFT_898643 [Mycena floridula]|nr:hypothetical protein C8J56DRAFT_898643 [Mycena floridula]